MLSFESGDVIWTVKSRFTDGAWANYKASNMKVEGLVAVEASKDLWAAFIRTMGEPRGRREKVARAEAAQLVKAWLSFDDAHVSKMPETKSSFQTALTANPSPSNFAF